MRKLEGRVALVTGAARGQGRSHAVRLAQEGAAIIALDACEEIDTVPYPLSAPEDLQETEELVRSLGAEVMTERVDIRNLDALEGAVEKAVARFGRLDVVVANAGTVNGFAPLWELTESQFLDQIDINVNGTWKTLKATVPELIKQKSGGSIILISSISGIRAEPNAGHYVASKHGVNGLMYALAAELAPYSIRVNSVNPGNVLSPLIDNEAVRTLFAGGKEAATLDDGLPAFTSLNALPIPWAEATDVSNAVAYLATDDSRYVTGTTMVVDGGALIPHKVPHTA
ncbi:mycofactocin-coupled SDR family oxidoreductase [Rhodococcus koreensis]